MPFVVLYWFLTGPALLLAALSLRGERKRAAYVARRLAERPQDLPPATVIVPVKGSDEGLRENLEALAALDYPDYELIVTAHSAGDIPSGVLPARVKVVLAHGMDPVAAIRFWIFSAPAGSVPCASTTFTRAGSTPAGMSPAECAVTINS